ncbi:hypothetical protein FHX74_003199 [Friedmanniella endophytica]|uniref:Uncharacterized protein n=1 Tax=Microlunatus kandeliicorticis TaxID=1759536 RepID=A0A7W3IUL9_9ACTN|nr:hypothetical protein [Microlunatus kandeliicorticis]MBA8795563.1 hypothetical protein [Microlunatus kandeliicorticis]
MATEILAALPRSPFPCPDWCRLPDGHPSDGQAADGREFRAHERPLGRVAGFSLDLVCDEVSSGDTAELSEPRLELYADDLTGLNADQANELAALLLREAGRLPRRASGA